MSERKPDEAQRAAVFVPDGEVSHFLGQLEKYALTTEKKAGERRHENFYDRVADLRLATLQALWTDEVAAYPADEDEQIWWEVWLRQTDGDEVARLHEFAVHADLRIGERRIQFDDRIVTLVLASVRQLATSLDVLNDLAELRRAKTPATFFLEQSNVDQAGWTEELASRVQRVSEDAPAICILDTGVIDLIRCSGARSPRLTATPSTLGTGEHMTITGMALRWQVLPSTVTSLRYSKAPSPWCSATSSNR